LSREVTFFAGKSKTGAILTIVPTPYIPPPYKPGEGSAQQEKERQQNEVHNLTKVKYGDVKPYSSNSSEGHFGPGKQGETDQGGAHHGQGQHDAPTNNANGKRKRKSD
jgi:hypothetical protein